MLRFILISLAFGWATLVVAEPAALMIGNEDYATLRNVGRGDEVARAGGAFAKQGVRVVARRDADAEAMRAALREFDNGLARSDTRLIALSGRFVHTQTETYFLGTETGVGSLSEIAEGSIALSTVFAWLAETPENAILVLAGYQPEHPGDALIREGWGELDIPEGVTVLTGIPRHSARFLTEYLAIPGRQWVPAARLRGLTEAGFAPRNHVFLKERVATPEEDSVNSLAFRMRDIRGWRQADTANTVDAYQQYLEEFPTGQFRRMAENRIRSLIDTPEARAERAEQSLDLNRDQRRNIQRNLSLLDFNTRGIDGIFGRGTRAAIASWQRAQNLDATGFITAEQITLLDTQAERRASELQAEAERRRTQQMAQDLAYWDETGALGDEAGLRAYLRRFPDGEYSEFARQELDRIERQNRRQATALDRQLWNEAAMENTARAYRDYIQLSPNGAFRAEAEERIQRLEGDASQSATAAARQEQALGLSSRTRRIVESRLESLGLRPGKVDGVLDNDSRRAIRRYQSARNLPETGYLSEAVVVQLLADSVRQILR